MVILSHTRYKDGAIRQQLAREFYPIKEGKKKTSRTLETDCHFLVT
jgi:hypothetical protein